MDNQVRLHELAAVLISAKFRLLRSAPFWGTLLMHLKLGFSDCDTACTDGSHISFAPSFMEQFQATAEETEFVLLHEVLHCALRHLSRQGARDQDLFNIAADLEVNSIALAVLGYDEFYIAGTPVYHTIDGEEGRILHTEEIYERLKKGSSPDIPPMTSIGNGHTSRPGSVGTKGKHQIFPGPVDNHDGWERAAAENPDLDSDWTMLVQKAASGVHQESLRKLLDINPDSTVDWRTLLHDFLSTTLYDYSWQRPDRRYAASPFVLPSFQASWPELKDIVFAVDTSGSMSDTDLTVIFNELTAMIEDLGGRGWLCFFDGTCTTPVPFENAGDLTQICPIGGGGTSYHAIFDMLEQQDNDDLKVGAVVILTDGYARYPTEDACGGLPLFWIFTKQSRQTEPEYGTLVRLQ